MNRALTSLIRFALVCAAGCSPLQGYPGPELPSDQISLLKYSWWNSSGLDVAMVDGYEFDHSGVTVKPGSHAGSIGFTVYGKPYDCSGVSCRFDWSSWSTCLKNQQKKKSYCNCLDYYSCYETCLQDEYKGVCAFSLDTKAGQEYRIEGDDTGNGFRLRIVDDSSESKLLDESCSRRKTGETQTIENSKGSGAWAASQYGYSYCP